MKLKDGSSCKQIKPPIFPHSSPTRSACWRLIKSVVDRKSKDNEVSCGTCFCFVKFNGITAYLYSICMTRVSPHRDWYNKQYDSPLAFFIFERNWWCCSFCTVMSVLYGRSQKFGALRSEKRRAAHLGPDGVFWVACTDSMVRPDNRFTAQLRSFYNSISIGRAPNSFTSTAGRIGDERIILSHHVMIRWLVYFHFYSYCYSRIYPRSQQG